jgi:hypothetical protein
MWKSHSADTKYHLLLLVLVLSFSDTHHVKAEVLDQSFIASPQNLIAGIGAFYPRGANLQGRDHRVSHGG